MRANPFMSMWLSGANAVIGSARSRAPISQQREGLPLELRGRVNADLAEIYVLAIAMVFILSRRPVICGQLQSRSSASAAALGVDTSMMRSFAQSA